MLNSFLDDIVERQDSTTWLIMADWLEDQNDPRAELVRLTWQLIYESCHVDFSLRQFRLQQLLRSGVTPVRPKRIINGVEFVWIPNGWFIEGSPATEKGRQPTEWQQTFFVPKPFWMSIYPITQKQFQKVAGYNPSFFARDSPGAEPVSHIPGSVLEDFPVEWLNHYEAIEFCYKFGHDVTLPTSSLWEYACRAGTTTPWSFGTECNREDALCAPDRHVNENSLHPAPVNSVCYYPNAWGLYGMHGNVWEWTSSTLPDANNALIRGGSFLSTAKS